MATRPGATETLGTFSHFSREEHATLLIRHKGESRIETLSKGQNLVVGRLAPSDVVVPSAKLSRQHARFGYDEAGPWVEDLGSRNGTLLKGKSVSRATLHSGDTLLVGDVTVSVYVSDPPEIALAGVMSHGRFVTLLEAEAVRTRVLGTFATLLLARDREDRGARACLQWLKGQVRPSDAVSLYSPTVVEVLLTDVDATGSRAKKVAEALTEQGLYCGGALLPGSAATAQDLIAQACGALEDAARGGLPALREIPVRANVVEGGIVTDSVTMKKLVELVRRVADSAIPVLIFGETGSGKEVIARAIHEHSPRAEAALCAVNCGALLPQLVESTLFGHERGAFTGADRQKKGLFEEAHGGTLFLDEIGELPPSAQASLLRVLETKKVTRVGATREIPVDVRVVAASHRRLESMCETGAFRQDLLFRLNVMTLLVPPLREHPEDIDGLVDLFVERAARANQREAVSVSRAARDLLYEYAWPGNVRELRNEIERAMVVCRSQSIQPEDLSDRLRDATSNSGQPLSQTGAIEASGLPIAAAMDSSELEGLSLRDRVHDFERRVIIEALERCQGNQTLAAKWLQMPRRTLVHKIRLHEIK